MEVVLYNFSPEYIQTFCNELSSKGYNPVVVVSEEDIGQALQNDKDHAVVVGNCDPNIKLRDTLKYLKALGIKSHLIFTFSEEVRINRQEDVLHVISVGSLLQLLPARKNRV